MADDPPSDVRSRYRDFLRRTTERVDTRIILQMQRIIALKLDEIFVPLTVREEPRERREDSESLRAALDADAFKEDLEPQRQLLAQWQRGTRPSNFARTEVPVEEMLRESPLNVLLGDPGSGKSTVLRWLTRAWTEPTDPSPAAAARLLPVPVTLRYFAAWLVEHPAAGKRALAEFLAEDAWEDTDNDAPGFGHLTLGAAADGEAILLLDGLDEALNADARRLVVDAVLDFLGEFPRCQCLVTSRVVGYESAPLPASFQAWHVEPMSDGKIGDFYDRWAFAIECSEDITVDDFTRRRADARRDDILASLGLAEAFRAPPAGTQPGDSNKVRELARNPMLATLIGLIHHQGRRLPRDRAELYRLCLEAFIYDWEIQKRVRREDLVSLDKHETLDVLEEIAFQLHDRGGDNRMTAGEMTAVAEAFLREHLGTAPAAARERAERLISLVGSRAGLLIDRGNRTANPAQRELGFSHLQFQEYLAGRALVRRRRDIPTLLHPRVWQARWREPILLAAAYLGEQNANSASEFIEMVWETPAPADLAPGHRLESMLPHAEFLALECVRDTPRVEIPLRRKTRERLHGIFIDRSRTWRWLPAAKIVADGEAKMVMAPLVATLRKDEDSSVRWAAARALGALRAPEAVGPLLAALQKEVDYSVRMAAGDALGELRAPEAVEPLLDALRKDKNFDVRRAAARALGALRVPEVVGPLLDALHKDENLYVRWAIIDALGALRAPEAVGPLLDALQKEEDSFVRGAAADALGALRAPETVGPLLTAHQKEKDILAIKAVARALGALRAQAAVRPLLIALQKDENSYIRWAAADALGSLGASEAIGPLLDALQKDEDLIVRAVAAEALGTLRAPEAVGPLLATLQKDEISGVRGNAARALGALRAPEAVGPLLAALQEDKNFDVRAIAAQTLGALRASEAVRPLLVALQKDEKPHVRRAAARALGALRAPEAVDPLLATLQKDDDSFVRESAAQALGEIKSKSAAPDLAAMLESPADRPIWQEVEEALTAIACS